jgi:cell division protein ZapD
MSPLFYLNIRLMKKCAPGCVLSFAPATDRTSAITSHADALHFFRNIGDLLDVLNAVRSYRSDERAGSPAAEAAILGGSPGVDQDRINELRQQLKQSGSTLMSAPRIGQYLREDRLIALVRQRLSIPGGCCSFDLPTLHIWLHMPQAYRDEQVGKWLASLEPLTQSLMLILDLIRNSAPSVSRPA